MQDKIRDIPHGPVHIRSKDRWTKNHTTRWGVLPYRLTPNTVNQQHAEDVFLVDYHQNRALLQVKTCSSKRRTPRQECDTSMKIFLHNVKIRMQINREIKQITDSVIIGLDKIREWFFPVSIKDSWNVGGLGAWLMSSQNYIHICTCMCFYSLVLTNILYIIF